jgi:hypothetical protein
VGNSKCILFFESVAFASYVREFHIKGLLLSCNLIVFGLRRLPFSVIRLKSFPEVFNALLQRQDVSRSCRESDEQVKTR